MKCGDISVGIVTGANSIRRAQMAVSVGKHKVEKMAHKDMSGMRGSMGKKKDDCGNMKK